ARARPRRARTTRDPCHRKTAPCPWTTSERATRPRWRAAWDGAPTGRRRGAPSPRSRIPALGGNRSPSGTALHEALLIVRFDPALAASLVSDHAQGVRRVDSETGVTVSRGAEGDRKA